MVTEVDLLTDSEKAHALDFFNRSINKLPKEDQELGQIIMMRGLIKKGIGIHYGGIIPILREIVEILLSDGFLKVVFCTSSFEMGINVPVRTCCFTTIDKFNGENIAALTRDEYMQMSGRAGRRGLDTFGYSLILASEEYPDYESIHRLICAILHMFLIVNLDKVEKTLSTAASEAGISNTSEATTKNASFKPYFVFK